MPSILPGMPSAYRYAGIMSRKHLDLFSGIGGFALASQWAGFDKIGFSEIDPYASKVLSKHWPSVPNYGDIRNVKGSEIGTVELITGGFPCQPFSVAGKRKGKEDDRHLWPEMFRVIQECQPRWVIGENVAGIIEMELESCILDLERDGYEVQPFIIPACAVNAPHRRDRVWIIANSIKVRSQNSRIEQGGLDKKDRRQQASGLTDGNSKDKTVAHSSSKGLQGSSETEHNGKDGEESRNKQPSGFCGVQGWDKQSPVSPVCGMDDGVSHRVDRLKGLGNAIVPQVAYEIIKNLT